MSAKDFLASLESLTAVARIRKAIEMGRSLREVARSDELIRALIQEGAFGRFICVWVATGAKNGDALLRLSQDENPVVVRAARSQALHVCTHQQLQELIGMVADRDVFEVLAVLRRRHPQLVDAIVLKHFNERPYFGRVLLPLLSTTALTNHREVFLQFANSTTWSRLAKWHPDATVDLFLEWSQSLSPVDPLLRRRAYVVVAALSRSSSVLCARLIERLSFKLPIETLPIESLAARSPLQAAKILLAVRDREFPSVSLSQRVFVLPPEEILDLARTHARSTEVIRYRFRRLRSPALRRRVFRELSPGWRDADGRIPESILAALPRDLRTSEAIRHLELPALQGASLSSLSPYLLLLPLDQALERVSPYLNDPKPEIRALAFRVLVGACRDSSASLSEVLSKLTSRLREPDPFRAAIVSQLAQLPTSRFRTEHVSALGSLIESGMSSTDFSSASAMAFETLLMRLVSDRPELRSWAAGWLAKLLRWRTRFESATVYRYARRALSSEIEDALAPVAEEWLKNGKHENVLSLCESLAERLVEFPRVSRALARVLKETHDNDIAERAARSLRLYAPREFDLALDRMLKPSHLFGFSTLADRSVGLLRNVHLHLHERRQDLLSDFLGQRAHKGRFNDGSTSLYFVYSSGFERWTPTQQAIFSKTLERVLTNEKAGQWELLASARMRFRLCWLDEDAALRLLQIRAPFVREALLPRLSRLSGKRGLQAARAFLTDPNLDKDAMNVISFVIRRLDREDALREIRQTQTSRVSIAKELARLLGIVDSDDAFEELKRLLANPALHTSVRIAALQALGGHLARPGAWEILLESCRRHPDETSHSLPTFDADEIANQDLWRLSECYTELIANANPTVRTDIIRQLGSPRFLHGRSLHLVLMDLIASGNTAEMKSAFEATLNLWTPEWRVEFVLRLRRIRSDRYRLMSVLDAIEPIALEPSRRTFVDCVREVLSEDPALAPRTASLSILVSEPEAIIEVLEGLIRDGLYFADTEASVERAIVRKCSIETDPKRLQTLEARLAAHRDPRVAKLAVNVLVSSARTPFGWDEAKKQRLEAYATSKEVEVRARASFIFPA